MKKEYIKCLQLFCSSAQESSLCPDGVSGGGEVSAVSGGCSGPGAAAGPVCAGSCGGSGDSRTDARHGVSGCG